MSVSGSKPNATLSSDSHESSAASSPGGAGFLSLAFIIPIVLIAGGLAGLASWGMGEWAEDYFAPSFDMSKELMSNALKSTAEVGRQKRVALLQTAAVSYGSLGAFLGFSLGIAGGLVRRSPSKGFVAAVVGTLLGGAVCAGASLGLIPIYLRVFQESPNHLGDDLLFPLMIHAGMWAGAGVAGGLAFGLGSSGGSRAALACFGGALGAVIGTVVFEALGAVLYPLALTSSPISTSSGARLFAASCVAILSSLVAVWTSRPSNRTSRVQSP
ncbi:hypothetical protein ACYOEI_13075 [Singulisphaera rosea]